MKKQLSTQFKDAGHLCKWLLISIIVGTLVGSAVAWFLMGLEWAGNFRDDRMWIIWFLPLGGLCIGLTYHYLGQNVVKGNNQLLDEVIKPSKVIPLRMAPLVALGTIATHLFGGSAGREGTAVQMGGSIADQFSKVFKLDKAERKLLLIAGIAAGFSAVFGTPLAGAVFALEVYVIGRVQYQAILPAFLSAIIADQVCIQWKYPAIINHTHYLHPDALGITPANLFFTFLAAILFGWAAMLFSKANHFWSALFSKKISYPPLRPFIGGIILALAFWGLSLTSVDFTKYIGLGVPVIESSFTEKMMPYDFALKLLFTSFTLGAGFKGGEVTPLFFIGATLGSALSLFIPLPLALLAAIGFVGVFSGATNTPIACTLMGIELFGAQIGVYLGLSCVVAYIFSGHSSIYSSQILGHVKHPSLKDDEDKALKDTHS
ncbi:voltage-gated chloride channel family protein [Lentisphaera profundi]|uniref:Voltage-gated chloride channel family protein n=1 Tax=Lentisphaera profundi TaxID=1658616 RepID=A0ABY7VYK5_9BACT|nr:voltage-gated chloride channel family protein [Lentisphaera profundi]WDE98354.1 voltage-gated chloride channel family protein [Lentisphaera profundi]